MRRIDEIEAAVADRIKEMDDHELKCRINTSIISDKRPCKDTKMEDISDEEYANVVIPLMVKSALGEHKLHTTDVRHMPVGTKVPFVEGIYEIDGAYDMTASQYSTISKYTDKPISWFISDEDDLPLPLSLFI